MAAPGGLLAGTAKLTIDGETYLLRGEFKYKSATRKRESLAGMDTVHGYKETVSPPYIAGNLSDWGGLTVQAINQMTSVTVEADLANGKTIIGRTMWTVEEQEVDSAEGTFDVRFEGPDGCVTEVTTS